MVDGKSKLLRFVVAGPLAPGRTSVITTTDKMNTVTTKQITSIPPPPPRARRQQIRNGPLAGTAKKFRKPLKPLKERYDVVERLYFPVIRTVLLIPSLLTGDTSPNVPLE